MKKLQMQQNEYHFIPNNFTKTKKEILIIKESIENDLDYEHTYI